MAEHRGGRGVECAVAIVLTHVTRRVTTYALRHILHHLVLACAPVEKPWIVRYEPLEAELAPTAYAEVAAAQSFEPSAVSMAAWSRLILLCSTTSEPGK